MVASHLGKNAQRVLSQITQVHNTPFNRLTTHSHWQENVIRELENKLEHYTFTNGSPTANAIPVELIQVQQKMLEQLQNNTSFIQEMVHKQENTLQKNSRKVSTMQNSFSWQITGPIRATGTVLKNSPKLKSALDQQVKRVNKKLNKLPILNKLLENK